ncbi:hypothetical protein V8B97DRAFT_1917937 [Scleroderma yunnanense]
MPSLMTNSPPISSRQAKSSNMKQWLQEDELDILKQFLEDWIVGDTAQRQIIFKNVGDCIQHLAPNRMLKSHQWDMKAKRYKAAVEQKGRKYTQQFTEEVWRQCGMQVMVMVAWKGPDRDVLTSFHNYNDEITNGQMFDNWGHMEDRWCQYANDMFGPLESPQPEDSGKACGQQSATVLWGAISDDVKKYISLEYLPADVRFKEPTKLSIDETTRILEWWQDWQEGSPNDIFKFKILINSDGSVHPPVSARHQQLKVAGKQKQHVKDDSDDTENNNEHGNMKDGRDELHLERNETSEMESSDADSHKAAPITHSSIKVGDVLQRGWSSSEEVQELNLR